ncbi:MAG: Na+:solute symporter [Planctomycetes bacterium]|nr:Na+:solute symporter [Planctomycetota bacterium]
MHLELIDWAIIAGYFVLSLGIGLWFKNKAGESFVEYFASGRSLPWWIAGTSMVATTFAADTPLAVTGLVAKNGLAGNWFWWAWAFGGMLTVFVFAKLWRRAEVITDVELIEQRYAGRPAAALRGFRAFYISVVMNSIVIGWVTKAMADVLKQTVLHDESLPRLFATMAWAGSATTPWAPAATAIHDTLRITVETWWQHAFPDYTDFWLVAAMLGATGVYSTLSGMWGVAITDVIQFLLAMVGCVALAVVAVAHVGGIDALHAGVDKAFAGQGDPLAFVPDFSVDNPVMGLGVFLVYVLTQWWATWYPGNEPGGGGYIVQRMASCKDEKHAVKATLLFQLAHYCLRPWPWILVAFAAVVLHPELRTAKDPGVGYPMLIRELAPIGLRGLLLVTFAAAFMSTISTQMNWGASYLVNDVYKRFVAPDADDRAMLRASRWASVLVLLLGGAVAFVLITRGVSVDDAWAFLAALGAGVGGVFLLRWFWWRINVWSEIVAMVGSLAVFLVVKLWQGALPEGERMATEYASLLVALVTLGLWLSATMLTQPEPRDHLVAFYRRIRPEGPGWGPIAAAAPEVRTDGALGRSLVCAVLGTATIFLTLPGIGALIFGDYGKGAGLLAGAAVTAGLMLGLHGLAARGASRAQDAR